MHLSTYTVSKLLTNRKYMFINTCMSNMKVVTKNVDTTLFKSKIPDFMNDRLNDRTPYWLHFPRFEIISHFLKSIIIAQIKQSLSILLQNILNYRTIKFEFIDNPSHFKCYR